MEEQIHQREDIIDKYDSVLVNLNIIATIDTNDKLFIREGELCRQVYSKTRAITRWWNNYNREDSKVFITELYKNISEIIISLTSIMIKTNVSKHKRNKIKKKQKKRQKALITACNNSKKGLLHLMMTYSKDKDFNEFINNTLNIIDEMY